MKILEEKVDQIFELNTWDIFTCVYFFKRGMMWNANMTLRRNLCKPSFKFSYLFTISSMTARNETGRYTAVKVLFSKLVAVLYNTIEWNLQISCFRSRFIKISILAIILKEKFPLIFNIGYGESIIVLARYA